MLKEEGITEIDFNVDYYRLIPTDEWENYTEDITVIGSLDDDIASLKSHITGEDDFMPFVDLDRIASILRAISQKYNPI